MKQSPIAVVGSTGTVGSQVVSQLVAQGHQVRALVRDPRKVKSFGVGVDVTLGDLAEPDTLAALFDGARNALVLAPPVPDMEALEANAFAAAVAAGVEHIVYLSNFGAGTFDDDLFQAHGRNEARLKRLGVTWTILRPVRFMSNTPFSWASVRDSGMLIEALGGRRAPLIDPRDIAAVAVKGLTDPGHEGKVYEIMGEALHGDEMALALSEALGRKIAFVDASEEQTNTELLRAGFPPFVVEKILIYFRTVREGRWYETRTLADLLGRAPRTYPAWLHQNVNAASADHADRFPDAMARPSLD